MKMRHEHACGHTYIATAKFRRPSHPKMEDGSDRSVMSTGRSRVFEGHLGGGTFITGLSLVHLGFRVHVYLHTYVHACMRVSTDITSVQYMPETGGLVVPWLGSRSTKEEAAWAVVALLTSEVWGVRDKEEEKRRRERYQSSSFSARLTGRGSSTTHLVTGNLFPWMGSIIVHSYYSQP